MGVNNGHVEYNAFPGAIAAPSILVGGDLGMVAGIGAYNLAFAVSSDGVQVLPLLAMVVAGCFFGAVVGAALGWVADGIAVWRRSRIIPAHRPA